MDNALLGHLLQLAAKTGDRLIVVDPNSQRPFVLMGLSQYEALLGYAVQHQVLNEETERDADRIGLPTIAPGTDPVAQAANAELTAWRAQQPAQIPPAEFDRVSGSEVESTPTVQGFSPEPLQSVLPEEDRFYVEPLE